MGQKILVDQNCTRAPFPHERAFWIDRVAEHLDVFPQPSLTLAQRDGGRHKNDFSDEMGPTLSDRLHKPSTKRMADNVARCNLQGHY